jgi:hypothetical protein
MHFPDCKHFLFLTLTPSPQVFEHGPNSLHFDQPHVPMLQLRDSNSSPSHFTSLGGFSPFDNKQTRVLYWNPFSHETLQGVQGVNFVH